MCLCRVGCDYLCMYVWFDVSIYVPDCSCMNGSMCNCEKLVVCFLCLVICVYVWLNIC